MIWVNRGLSGRSPPNRDLSLCLQVFDIVLDFQHLAFQNVSTLDEVVVLVDLFFQHLQPKIGQPGGGQHTQRGTCNGAQQPQQPDYQQPVYQQPDYQQPAYQQPVQPAQPKPAVEDMPEDDLPF